MRFFFNFIRYRFLTLTAFFRLFKNVPKVLIPAFWFAQSVEMNEALAKSAKVLSIQRNFHVDFFKFFSSRSKCIYRLQFSFRQLDYIWRLVYLALDSFYWRLVLSSHTHDRGVVMKIWMMNLQPTVPVIVNRATLFKSIPTSQCVVLQKSIIDVLIESMYFQFNFKDFNLADS